jgi:hypothetical protein
MRVELDVFSGRPNPSWQLSPDEIAGLNTRLAGLPRCDQPIPDPVLGYRGFVLSNPQAAPGLPLQISVHDGAVAIRTEAGAQCYTDVNGVESWLLDLARARGHSALLRELGK